MRIVISGFGGQGVLTLGSIIAEIAMEKGKNVTWMPSYGAEMRGGTANCAVIIADKLIGSPMVKNNIDILCAMNAPSVDKFLTKVVQGGIAIVNTSIVTGKLECSGVNIVEVDATNIATRVGRVQVANMVMLAGFIKSTGIFTVQDVESALRKRFAGKPSQIVEINMKAIAYGL